MTTTTVEVEETRTIEEEVTVCNQCQREVDAEGREFSPSSRAEAWLSTPVTRNSLELQEDLQCIKRTTGYIVILATGFALLFGVVTISPYVLPFSGLLIPVYIVCLLAALVVSHMYYGDSLRAVRKANEMLE